MQNRISRLQLICHPVSFLLYEFNKYQFLVSFRQNLSTFFRIKKKSCFFSKYADIVLIWKLTYTDNKSHTTKLCQEASWKSVQYPSFSSYRLDRPNNSSLVPTIFQYDFLMYIGTLNTKVTLKQNILEVVIFDNISSFNWLM